MDKVIEEAIVVVGAGAGGLATAISAARRGARVVLLEKADRVGGTVSRSLIHTIAGLYDSRGEFINEGLPIELAERLIRHSSSTSRRRMGRVWVLSTAPDIYEQVVGAWIGEQERLEFLDKASIERLIVDEGRVAEIEVRRGNNVTQLRPLAVVDCTGEAEIVRRVNPQLANFGANAAAGLIFTMAPVESAALRFPRNIELLRMVHSAARSGTLPAACEKAWLDAGVHEQELYVKLFLPMGRDWQKEAARHQALLKGYAQRDKLVGFLKTFPPCRNAEVTRTGELGIRDGGRITGHYLLTAEDVRHLRRFPDAAARCSWPIEYWDPQKGVQLEYLPDGTLYEIPLRSLKVKGVVDLWVAGKCLSADPEARASARVAGCCWAMGESVGQAVVSDLC